MEDISRKVFSCSICQKRYTRRSGLKSHIKHAHEGAEKRYKCLYCEKSFRNLSNKNRHQRVVHMGLKEYDCDICGLPFSFKWLVECHKKEHHGVGEKKRCRCGRSFSYSSNLYAHQRICTTVNPAKGKEFECDKCGKKYKTEENLKKHTKYDHDSNQEFVCELCGDIFTRPWSLTRHKSRKHKDQTTL